MGTATDERPRPRRDAHRAGCRSPGRRRCTRAIHGLAPVLAGASAEVVARRLRRPRGARLTRSRAWRSATHTPPRRHRASARHRGADALVLPFGSSRSAPTSCSTAPAAPNRAWSAAAGNRARCARRGRSRRRVPRPTPFVEPLTESELRVLRYLPSNLTAPEIAGRARASTSTVKTHMRHIYEKLGVHRGPRRSSVPASSGCSRRADSYESCDDHSSGGRRGLRPTTTGCWGASMCEECSPERGDGDLSRRRLLQVSAVGLGLRAAADDGKLETACRVRRPGRSPRAPPRGRGPHARRRDR